MPNRKNEHTLTQQPGSRRGPTTVEQFKQQLIDNLYYQRGQGAYTATPGDLYMALVYTVRDALIERWRDTIDDYVRRKPRFVYYLSAEYLPGRQITQNLLYTGLEPVARQALAEMGVQLDELLRLEPEPALGNGGLGRLAACYCDSLATLDVPAVCYGIQYEFGIFRQSFVDGYQVEAPDDWLNYGNPWAFPQPDNRVRVGFGGTVQMHTGADGRQRAAWTPDETVLGEPSHMLIPGYGTHTVNMLRLWRARASQEFDFQLFDVGDYARAAEQKISSENISKVLYPNDNTAQGRELRLRQEYFFVACSLRDILRRFLSFEDDWERLPEQVVIQLNDTHPVVVIPELMRILVDEVEMDWEEAWNITTRVFAYTCHTLMPEALEKWPVSIFERLLPRHLQIIYEINARFLAQVQALHPGDSDLLRRVSLIEEWPEKAVRMANLAALGSFSVNGVAELHTRLLQQQVLPDFAALTPHKFNNKTNGVSPRRFVQLANPRLTALINEAIGTAWQTDLQRLRDLEPLAEDAAFRAQWRAVKQANKRDLADVMLERTGVESDPNSLFDVMVKRLHLYKRQLLKALHIVTLYNRIHANPELLIAPRTCIFGAKAAPGYKDAKMVIKLINTIAQVVNADPLVSQRLRVCFLPNLNVTLGEKIYPAAELSEQISTAGKEASGTGNMKFALNGALTIGTLDGANIEIREQVGADNFFLFGLTAEEVLAARHNGYNPRQVYQGNPELRAAIDAIGSGAFAEGGIFQPLVQSLLEHDEFLLLADYAGFCAAQERVEAAYADSEGWTRMSIRNCARAGLFSSDRAVREYCEGIWKVPARGG